MSTDRYYKKDEWWVSPFNEIPAVRNTYQLPEKVYLHDATLRDGEQTPGIVFDIADKIAIAEKLDEIGVDRIEAGMPAVSEMDFQAIKEISKLNLKAKIYTFARAMNALEGVPLRLVSQAASRRNITFVMRDADVPQAMNRLHDAFFATV